LYDPAVGAVAFAIQELGEQWGEKIPPVNLIVVQAGTQLPGHGADGVAHYYFDDGGAEMAANRKAYVQAAMAAVFDYGPKWDRVAQALGVDVLDAAHATRDEGNPIELPPTGPKVTRTKHLRPGWQRTRNGSRTTELSRPG